MHELNLHGQTAILESGADGWALFGSGYGDFGHTINIHAFIDGKEVDVYYLTGDELPNENGTQKIENPYFVDDTSQNAVFGVNAGESGKRIIVTYASNVFPIHPNSGAALVYSLFVFFAINFAIAGVLQFIFFKNAINPNDYNFNYSQPLNT